MGALDIVALAILVLLAAGAVLAAVVLAMLPGKIAAARSHPQKDAVRVAGWLGIIAGGLLWPLALVWAYWVPRSSGSRTEEIEALSVRVARLESNAAKEGVR